MQPQRPLSMKKQIQLLLILTLLAWATQTLLAQWGFGQTIELRPEATVYSEEVTLKQVARWSDADAAKVGPIADVTIARFESGKSFRTITLDEVQATLEAAGANVASARFAGPFSCTVTLAGTVPDEGAELAAWTGKTPQTTSVNTETRSLRKFLVEDLSVRLDVPTDQLQVTFNPKDEKTLALAEPQFKFSVTPRRGRNLGQVSWEVQILSPGGITKSNISAMARAWQDQVLAVKPLVSNQIIRAEDVESRRVLTDQLPEDKPLSAAHVVGQQAGRDMKVGAVITAKTIEAVPLVRSGQYVSVTIQQGGLQIKAVAKAMEGGAYGQTIKVRNESTKQIYDAVVSGPQTAVVGSL